MNNDSVIDELYSLPPSSVRDLTVDYEIINLNDICKNGKNSFTKNKNGETSAINVKIEASAESQDFSHWNRNSNFSPTTSNQFWQTSSIEKDLPSTPELLRDSFQNENRVFCNPNISTSNSKTSLPENGEDILKYSSTDVINPVEENNEAFKNTKISNFNDISKQKVKNNFQTNSNNELHQRKTDLCNPLERLTTVPDLINNSFSSIEIPIRTTSTDISTKNLNSDSNTGLRKNLQREFNDSVTENVQIPMLLPLNSNAICFDNNIITNENLTDKETTPSFIQSKNNETFESKETNLKNTNSSEIENAQINCNRNLENNSMEDSNSNSNSNESIRMLKFCKDTDLKDSMKVEKDFINQCLKNWKKNYPWASLEEDSWILSCTVCSYYTSKSVHICQIRTSCDIYQVAKYLRDHDILPKHRLLSFFGNFDIFQKIYGTLKDILKTFPTENILYINIKSIVNNYSSSSVNKTDIIFLIDIVASVIRESVISSIRSRMSYGIGFVCDPCRNILIVKYSDSQNYPQESVITNYVNTDSPIIALKKVFSINNLEKEIFTFGKLLKCPFCLPQNSKSNECKENTLPPPLPFYGEFLYFMRKSDTILAFENFIYNLSVIYNQNPHYFQLLNGHALLKRPMWVQTDLNSFIFQNYQQLQLILNSRYEFSTNDSVSYCKAYVLDSSPFFHSLINATFCIANYLYRRNFDQNSRRDLMSKMEKYLEILRSYKYFHSANNMEALYVLSIYYKEIISDSYYNGIRNVQDFDFLFDAQRMTNLLDHNLRAAYDRNVAFKIWYTFHKFIPLSEETFKMKLSHFGKELLKVSTKRIYTFWDIIELFNHTPELSMKYPCILKIYTAVGTLPFIISRKSRSITFIAILKYYLERNFNSNVSNNLLAIVTEESTATGCDIYGLYQMAMNKILAL